MNEIYYADLLNCLDKLLLDGTISWRGVLTFVGTNEADIKDVGTKLWLILKVNS